MFVPKTKLATQKEEEKAFPKELIPKIKAFTQNKRNFMEINFCDKKSQIYKMTKNMNNVSIIKSFWIYV